MDLFLIHLGMTHPDLWILWAGIILGVVNRVGLILLRRKKGRNENHDDSLVSGTICSGGTSDKTVAAPVSAMTQADGQGDDRGTRGSGARNG